MLKQSYQRHIWDASGAEVFDKYACANIRVAVEENKLVSIRKCLVSEFLLLQFYNGFEFSSVIDNGKTQVLHRDHYKAFEFESFSEQIIHPFDTDLLQLGDLS